jgi:hypothetical protein
MFEDADKVGKHIFFLVCSAHLRDLGGSDALEQ